MFTFLLFMVIMNSEIFIGQNHLGPVVVDLMLLYLLRISILQLLYTNFTFMNTKPIRRCMFSGTYKGQRFNVSRMSLKGLAYGGEVGSLISQRW